MLSITKSRKNKILYFLSTILLILIKPTICKINKQGGIAVMGLDLGSEYFKVAIVKPGVPMEIALNGESKRKTPTVITIKGEDTLAGSPALTTGIKFPPKSFRYVFNLLGKDFNSPEVEKFQKNFPHYQLIPDEDHNLVMFKHDENNFSVDQIVALILKSAQEIASNHAETQVKDCVITVPVFMSQNERKRLVSIAENMANLKVLELINDNAAIALNYGMFRRKEFADKAKNLIIYDMGATRSTASVVKIETDEKTKDPVATVLGVAWDRSLGGVEFDLRIQNFLKTKFEEKNPKLAPVTKHRALAKLLAESQRVRQVLSANTETLARIENLTGDDVDLKIPITREDLETLCSDLLDRSMEPVLKALDMSGLAKEIVNEILMFGGLTRTPQIKAKLENEGFTLLANINTDEAAAIGASYRAADLSSAFRVKPFGIKNASPVQIQVEFDRETTDEETGEKKIKHSKRILFNVGATYPQKKILTFNRYTDDFEFEVNYGNPAEYTHLTTDQAYYPENDNLMKVKISGVSKALTDNENKQTKGIKVHFKMDESGIFSYTKVESLFEEDVLIPPTPKKKEEEKVEKEGEEAAGSEGKEDADKEAELDKKAAENQEKNKNAEFKIDDALENDPDAAHKIFKDSNFDEFKNIDWSSPDTIDPGLIDRLKKKFGDFAWNTKDGKLGNTFDEEKKEEAEHEVNADGADASDNADKAEEGAKDAEKTQDEEEEAPKYKKVKSSVTLSAEGEFTGTQFYTEGQLKLQNEVLNLLEKREEEKRAREAALNRLESLVYDRQAKLEEEGGFKETISEEDSGKYATALSQASDFIWDVEDPTAKIYNDKAEELETMMKDWMFRAEEYKNRPRYLKELEDHFNHTKYFIAAVKANHEKQPEDDKTFTDKQVEEIQDKYNEIIDWKNTTVAKQEAMSPLEEPILTGKTIAEKARALDREVQWMAKKAKSWRPKPPPKEEKKEEAKDEEKKEDGATAEDPKADEETQNEDSTEEKSNDPTHEEL